MTQPRIHSAVEALANLHLGDYPTPELAHKAYCQAAQKYFGEFARTE
jgi:hypothetical protein